MATRGKATKGKGETKKQKSRRAIVKDLDVRKAKGVRGGSLTLKQK